MDSSRQRPRGDAPEMQLLTQFLEYHRATVLVKTEGLSDEQLKRRMVPSGTCLAGIVKHLAHVERWWFRIVLAGEALQPVWTKDDPEAEWRIADDETALSVLQLYEEEINRCRRAMSGFALDDRPRGRVTTLSGQSVETYTLRWIITHMIEETARHNGHIDILRELIDGASGE